MKLLIAYPIKPEIRGSFISNHIKFLKPDVELYFHLYPIYANKSLIFKPPFNNWIIRTSLKNLLPPVYKRVHEKFIIKLLRDKKITIVLAEYGPVGVSLYKACEKLGIPIVVHFHGYDAYKYDVLNKYKDGYKKMFDYASSIIAVSDDMVKQLKSLGAKENKITKISYGVDIEMFSPCNPSKNSLNIITVGNFTPKKAPHLSIKAFNEVLKDYPEANLTMIGTGKMFNECQVLVRNLKIEDKVHFLGKQNFETISSLLHSGRVFIQHSLRPDTGDSEGLPNAILEASAKALPIVSTKHAGIPEAVIHNKTGFLVKEGDYYNMANYIKRFLKDPKLAYIMGQNGRNHIIKNYKLSDQINKLEKLLNKHSLK